MQTIQNDKNPIAKVSMNYDAQSFDTPKQIITVSLYHVPMNLQEQHHHINHLGETCIFQSTFVSARKRIFMFSNIWLKYSCCTGWQIACVDQSDNTIIDVDYFDQKCIIIKGLLYSE